MSFATKHSKTATSLKLSAQQGFHERWHGFQGDMRAFPHWTPHWKEDELKARFDQIRLDRWSIYFENPDDCQKKDFVGLFKKPYQTPENWETLGSRYPYPLSFSYNLASNSYNASIITIKNKQFLAMEAPTKENQKAFYDVLIEFNATDLIRLTPAASADRESSFQYWEGRMNIHPKTFMPTIELGEQELAYFCTDCWEDDKGTEPNRLVALVKAVMSNESSDQMVAVHCRAGIGRTGTFLAAYALIREIDEQISRGNDPKHVQVSVDKIVWELSLQRPFMVAHFPQYMALYKLIDSYTS